MSRIDTYFSLPIIEGDILYLENLKKELESLDIEGCFAISAKDNYEENQFLLNLANQNQIIKGVIGWADLKSESAIEKLSYYSSHPKFLGVRLILKKFNAKDFLTETVRKSLEFLQARALTLDIVAEAKDLKLVDQLARTYPDLKLILNYLGKPHIEEGILIPWADDIFMLAEQSNVYCKINYFSSNNKEFTYQQLEPFISVVLHAFGSLRVMMGSPSFTTFDSTYYRKMFQIIDQSISVLSPEEVENISRENALRVYCNH